MGIGLDRVDRKSTEPRVTALDNSKSGQVIISHKMASPSNEMQNLGFCPCQNGTVFAYARARANGTENRHLACESQARRRWATEGCAKRAEMLCHRRQQLRPIASFIEWRKSARSKEICR